MGSRWMRNSFVYLLILVAVIAIVVAFFRPGVRLRQRCEDLSTVISDAKAGSIEKIEVKGNTLKVTQDRQHRPTPPARRTAPASVEILTDQRRQTLPIPIEVKEPSAFGDWLGLLLQFLPILIFIGLILFMMRQAQGTNSQAMSFGKSRARMFTANKPTVTFVDVAGVDEAKEELQEVVEFLKYPEKFAALGARIPRGVLLVGPPGTGKTLLARAVAGEAGVPFFSISGSEFVEMFVGVGASRVRDLFDQAKRNSPCIVFVDEIDAVGRQRGAGLGGSHDEREQTLNQILVEMDGFDTNTNVIVIAATNRPDILDPALLRPGRFDRQVVIDAPGRQGPRRHPRGAHQGQAAGQGRRSSTSSPSGRPASPAPTSPTSSTRRRSWPRAATRSASACPSSKRPSTASCSARSARAASAARARTRWSPTTSPATPSSPTSWRTSTRCSRSPSSPAAWPAATRSVLPDEDRHLNTRSYLEKMLAMMLGGHAAEEMVFGEMSTGASDDISKVTQMARAMVTRYGMSERLGPRTFGQQGRAGLPRPRNLRAARLLREGRRGDRRRGAPHHRPRPRRWPARSSARTAPSSTSWRASCMEVETLEGDAAAGPHGLADRRQPSRRPKPRRRRRPQPPPSDARGPPRGRSARGRPAPRPRLGQQR